MFEPSKLFVFYGKYLFRDWSNSVSYLLYSDSHSNFKFKGKIKFIAVSYIMAFGVTTLSILTLGAGCCYAEWPLC
jgi:hypothetical protein